MQDEVRETENTRACVQRIVTQQQDGERILSALGASLDNMAKSSLFTTQQTQLIEYMQKLQEVRASMAAIGKRTKAMQLKLNRVREAYPAHEKALLQRGPFYYKCVWQGGCHFREYPKEDAKSKAQIIRFGEVVKVDERVYITGESLVFLHVKGTGWLFENKAGIVVMKITSSHAERAVLATQADG
jgi:hypothetical protein